MYIFIKPPSHFCFICIFKILIIIFFIPIYDIMTNKKDINLQILMMNFRVRLLFKSRFISYHCYECYLHNICISVIRYREFHKNWTNVCERIKHSKLNRKSLLCCNFCNNYWNNNFKKLVHNRIFHAPRLWDVFYVNDKCHMIKK